MNFKKSMGTGQLGCLETENCIKFKYFKSFGHGLILSNLGI